MNRYEAMKRYAERRAAEMKDKRRERQRAARARLTSYGVNVKP